MAFRNNLDCYICNERFASRLMGRIHGDENAEKRQIAVSRRDVFGRLPLEVNELTKICANCDLSIIKEINTLIENPNCCRLNVFTQSRNSTCFMCNADNDIHKLSVECKAKVFILKNIYIPDNVKLCRHHLDDDGHILEPLLQGLSFINRPYIIKGNQLELFLQRLRNVSMHQKRIEDENSFTGEECKCLCSISKVQFNDLFTYCERVPCQNGYRYVSKKNLLTFLCKLRHGLSNDFLKVMFQYSSSQATSLIIATVRQSLMQRFVRENVGFDAISRDDYIAAHVTDFGNQLYNPEPEYCKVIACIDGTYFYIHKSGNFRVLRQSYCVHKGRHLIKLVLIVALDGYILEIQGPYFSDSRNNDAALLQNEFEQDSDRMLAWFQENDIMIVDRGYRDATYLLTRLGISWKMPAHLPPNQQQLNTEDANNSRLVTKSRWIVETRNGHIKCFKFLQQMIHIQHVPNLGDFCKIAGAIINKYHPLVRMEGADVETTNRMLEQAKEPNVVQALVELENLKTRNAQRWVRLDEVELVDFPVLTMDYLKNITIGVYQIKLAPSYIQDRLLRENTEEFLIEMLRDQNRLPSPGLLRVRIYSRFRNATKYQLWISYKSTDEDELNDEIDDEQEIFGYYCTCKAGSRTLGTCAHVSSVLWYLGYARHQENIPYPSTQLLDVVQDAGNRQQLNEVPEAMEV